MVNSSEQSPGEHEVGNFRNFITKIFGGKTHPKEDSNVELPAIQQNVEAINKQEKKETEIAAAETNKTNSHLGIKFEVMLSDLSETIPPPVVKEGGALADLGTNEFFDPERLRQEMSHPPNGYVFGIGAGNIFSLVHLFDTDIPPKGILAVDLSPQVVLTGRVAAQMIKESDNFSDFLSNILSVDKFKEIAEKVLDNETSEAVKDLMKTVDIEKAMSSVQREESYMPNTGIVSDNRISVLASIRSGWDVIKKLADEDNIGIGLADITNTEMLSIVKGLPDFIESNNIIYISNVIDHITNRGFNVTKETLEFTRPLSILDNRTSYFIDTTQNNEWSLRVHNKPPVYTRNDLD